MFWKRQSHQSYLLLLYASLIVPVRSTSILREIISSFGNRSPIVLFSKNGYHQIKMEWESMQPFGNPLLDKTQDEWTWQIYANSSLMPIRSNYYLSPPITYSKVYTRKVATMVKFLIWVDHEDYKTTTSMPSNLKYIGRFDFDIFVFIGSGAVFLENLLKFEDYRKIQHKFGVILEDFIKPKYIVEHPVSSQSKSLVISEKIPTFSIKTKKLDGESFTVSANTLAPYIMYDTESKRITGGTNYMMLQYASEYYNFTLNWDVGLTRGNGKLLEDGTARADGMLGAVLDESADIAFIARWALGQVGVIDLTAVNSVDTLVFLTRQPETHLAWAAVIHIFTPNAWALIAVCIVAVTPVYYISFKLEDAERKNMKLLYPSHHFVYSKTLNRNLNSELFYKAFNTTFGITFSQSVSTIPVQAYIISAFWMIFILNINTCYNSNLSSYLTSLTSEITPQDFDELSQRWDYNISFNYLNNGACDCFHFFNETKLPTLIKIRERFMQNLEPDTGQCVLNAVLKKKSCCIGWSSVMAMGIGKNATLKEGLNFLKISKSVHISLNSIGLQRHSPHTRSFSWFISGFRDMGLVTKFREDAESQVRMEGKRWIQNQKESEIYKVLSKLDADSRILVRPFDVENVELSFFILGAGWIITALIFLLEKAKLRKDFEIIV